MNNAFVQPEEPKKDTSIVQARLIRIIEALARLFENPDWRSLQELVFKEEEARLKRLLLSEAQKPKLDKDSILRIQGELLWAKRYADLTKYVQYIKNQLDNLKKHG